MQALLPAVMKQILCLVYLLHLGCATLTKNGIFESGCRPVRMWPVLRLREPTFRIKASFSNATNHVLNEAEVDCSKASLRESEDEVKCQLRDTVVFLESGGAHLSPEAVLVKRCIGMCRKRQECVAANTTRKSKIIRKVEFNKASCVHIEVEDDQSCECRAREVKCKSPKRIFGDQCACETRLNCAPLQFWDEQNCECVCRNAKKNCTTHSEWNSESCRCKKTKKNKTRSSRKQTQGND